MCCARCVHSGDLKPLFFTLLAGIGFVSSVTLAGMMGVAVAHDNAISLTLLSHLGAVDPSALIGN